MQTLILLFPDLALIVIGQLLYRKALWTHGFWQELEKMVYYLLFPALLFRTILKTDLGSAGALPAASVALAAVVVGIALGYLARPVLKPLPRQYASGVQCAFRFNSYVLLALSQRFAGEPGLALAAIIMGVTVPVLNVAAVWPLASTLGSGLLRELARNPLILATLAGLLGNLLGLRLPEPIDATIGRLGSASIALGLLATGAGLRLERAPGGNAATRAGTARLAAWFTAVKLVAMPATALLVSMAFGLSPLAQQVAVMYAAMPTASSAYILASRMGGDAAFVAMLVTISMFGALVGLPLWMQALR